jgi:hypothetical protein
MRSPISPTHSSGTHRSNALTFHVGLVRAFPVFRHDYRARLGKGSISMDSLQLRVLGFGLVQDGDVGVGVFPERQEILIRGAGRLVRAFLC